jgi:hypothetical protein
MKSLARYSIYTLLIIATSSCLAGKKQADANVVITPLSDTVRLMEGTIVYGLPRSVFNIVLEMRRTIEVPGPYSKYALDLLGLDNVITNETESWSVQNISIISVSEIDPSELYVIESNTLFQTNVLKLRKQGLILDLNPESYYSSDSHVVSNELNNSQLQWSDLGSDEYFQLQRDTAYKRVTVDSSFIRIPYIVEKKKKLSSDQLAEKAAKRLMEMRDGKHLILTGEATVFPQSDAAINEMNRLEKEYTELFTGKTISESRKFNVTIIPGKEMIGKPVTLFRYSELTGPVALTATGGKAVTIEFIPERKTKELTVVSKPEPDPKAPAYDKLYYRVPEVVNVKLNQGTENLYNSRRLIYQFGQVVQLPANYLIGK